MTSKIHLQIIIEEKVEEIKAHAITLKAKEAIIYVSTYFRKAKAPFRCLGLKQFIWQFKTGK